MKSKTVIYFQVVHLKKSYKATPAGVPKSHFSLSFQMYIKLHSIFC